MTTVKKHGRRNGEGSIYEIKTGPHKGRWVASTPPDAWGRRKTRTAHTSDEAQRKYILLMAERQNGADSNTTTRATLATFVEEWLEGTMRARVKPASFVRYSQMARRHFIPELGKLKLVDVKPQHISRYMRLLEGKGYSTSTINGERAILRAMFKQAVEWGLLSGNPVDAVRPVRAQHQEIVPFTPDEAQTFIEGVKGNRLEAMYCLAIIMGIREGELIALKWSAVDLDAGLIHIRATVCFAVKPPRFDEPKSKAARRKLRIPSMLVDRLRAHKAQQMGYRQAAGLQWDEDGLVFTGVHGGILRISTLQSGYKKVLVGAHLPNKRFHDLRHTAASIMIADGVPIKMVSEILGHAGVSITWAVYGHMYDQQREAALSTMEKRYHDV